MDKTDNDANDDDYDDDDLSWLPPGFRIVPGQRGRPKLVHAGYAFTKNKRLLGKTYWCCAQVRQSACRARLVLWRRELSVKVTQPEHTHGPEFGETGDEREAGGRYK